MSNLIEYTKNFARFDYEGLSSKDQAKMREDRNALAAKLKEQRKSGNKPLTSSIITNGFLGKTKKTNANTIYDKYHKDDAKEAARRTESDYKSGKLQDVHHEHTDSKGNTTVTDTKQQYVGRNLGKARFLNNLATKNSKSVNLGSMTPSQQDSYFQNQNNLRQRASETAKKTTFGDVKVTKK